MFGLLFSVWLLHEKLTVGVPFKGKYKEIFNSDAEKFGGSGKVNPRMKSSKAEECDGKENFHHDPAGAAWHQRLQLHADGAGEERKTGEGEKDDPQH